MHTHKIILYIILFLHILSAQTPVTLSLSQADSLFISKNLLVLAKKYNVDAQKALIEQARLLDNPSLYVEQNIYNSNNKRYFDMSKDGEYVFQIQQILYTAGKRNKRIQLATTQHQLSQQEFNMLLSALLYDLHQLLIQLYYQLKTVTILNNEISELQPLVNSFQEQFEKGNISLKEVFRLRSLLFNLQSAVSEYQSQINELQKNLMIYLQLNTNQIIPKVDELPKTDVLSSLTPFALKDTALKYRPDYQWSKLNFAYQQQNYSYQKSLAIPDFRIGYNFDKTGNFILNYNALSLSMDLPIFNRNQGNIKASEFLMKQSLTEVQQKEQEIFGELVAGIQQVKNLYSLYEQVQSDFIKNFENVKDGMQENFKKRNISVIEYTDFFESYINSVQQYYSLLMKYHLSVEQLNYVVSKKIIR